MNELKCIKCDWTGSADECDYWRGLICPECGANVQPVTTPAGAMLMNETMKMIERAMEAR